MSSSDVPTNDSDSGSPEIVDSPVSPAALSEEEEAAALDAAAALIAASSWPEVTFHLRGVWGFELHCNGPALDLIETIRDELISTIGKILPFKVRALIWMYIRIRRVRIRQVSGEQGARLVSPWPIPILLTPLPLLQSRPPSDTSLRWAVLTVMDNGQLQWSETEIFEDYHSPVSPGLAEFRNHLFCVHLGRDSRLYWKAYRPGENEDDENIGWSEAGLIGGSNSRLGSDSPSLATFDGRLYCVYRGRNHNENRLHWTTWDGTGQWSQIQDVPQSVSTISPPVLAVFQNTLFCLYTIRLSDREYYLSMSRLQPQGSAWVWSETEQIFNVVGNMAGIGFRRTNFKPGVAVFRGSLYCIFTLVRTLNMIVFDGQRWSTIQQIADLGQEILGTGGGVSAAVLDGRLIITYITSSQAVMWLSFDGNQWSSPQRVRNESSGDAPAIVVFRDKNMDADPNIRDQLLCVYRGMRR